MKMAFIKEESEEMRIEEAFKVKQEDTDKQTGQFPFLKVNSFDPCKLGICFKIITHVHLKK